MRTADTLQAWVSDEMKGLQKLAKGAGNSASRQGMPAENKEKLMKTLAVVLLALTSLAGCVAYPVYDNGAPSGHHGGAHRGDRDRDGDGVRNRDDRRPNNPNRY